MRSIYITGLKRHTGKTVIAAGLLGTMQSLSYATGYFKTIQTGRNSSLFITDEVFMKNVDSNIKTYTSYGFDSEQCPLLGAYNAGINKIDAPKITKDFYENITDVEFCIVEGTNGVSSPITDKLTEIDITKSFGIPLVLVLDAKKDTIDEVISGITYIRSHNVNLAGIIINSFDSDSENIGEKYFPQLVKEFTGVDIWGCFPYFDNYNKIGADSLIAEALNNFNVEDIFGLKISKLN